MKKGNIGIWAITLIIAGLVTTASATVVVPTSETEGKILKLTKISSCIASMDMTNSKTLAPQLKHRLTFDRIPLFEGINPTVASDFSNICLGFEFDEELNVLFTGTSGFEIGDISGGLGVSAILKNAGVEEWPQEAIYWMIDEPPEKPDLDSCGDGRFIGGMVPSPYDYNGGAFYKLYVTDVTDVEEGYSLSLWTIDDLGPGYDYIIDVGVGGYTSNVASENTWAYGATTMLGDYNGSGPQPMLSYQATEDGTAWFYSFSENLSGGESTDVSIDQDTKYMYGVWNYYNITLDQNDIFIQIMDFDTWDEYSGYPIHPEIGDYILTTSGSDDYVDISAKNDNVILASERDGDIVAYYSFDGLQSDIEEVIIETGAQKPKIVHTDEKTAICSFLKVDGLYMSETVDGGTTWSTPEKVSGSENAVSADVCSLGFSYEADDTIYFDSGDQTPPAEIEWSITATGGLLGMINKNAEGTVQLPPGTEETINLGMFLGIGTVSIKVIAGRVSKSVEGKQILIFTRI